MAATMSNLFLLCAIGIILLARPAHAFGAGNIGSTSKIEGQNWRHGDLEDTLLTLVAARAMGGKKFTKLDVKRVYFGNWLRDYSQAVDVGTVKYVSAEAIRILLWVLGFLSFGYGSGEFEVTTQRLGCYRPEEHIDNPKDYADNEDARQYDRRLRGPIDERRELSVDPRTGLKNYIANERAGIDTSAGLVRRLLGQSVELGRRYSRNKNKKDLYEALRLLGTASHCLEDYAAHSNYVELALIEMGERNVFPHVGRRTEIQLEGARGPVFPLVTGTFGGVDFLHSVCGEFDDKATQSEIEELEGTLTQYQNGNQDNSVLQDLLNKIPDGVFGGKDEAGKADELKQNAAAHQMQNTRISPRQPEEWTNYLNDVQKQIYPIIEWHDEVMQSITETIEKIPILPDLIESLQEEVNKFVFSLLAPYLLPIINQVKNELNTGSNEIIQSSKDKQHIVFNDDNSTDPTHSMLSKDHFSNILNEPAGKVARQTVAWVVPQVIAAWDDDSIDVDRTLNRIINGILHHPALRDLGQDGASDGRRLMFGVVEQWWGEKSQREKDGLRDQLSRRGVETGKNHKEGVKDHGHGSNKPLGMAHLNIGGGGSGQGGRPSDQMAGQIGQAAGAAVGGGVLGSLVGGIATAVGGDILGGGLGESKETYKRDTYGRDGSRTETVTQVGHSSSGDRYGQAQYTRTTGPGGERRHEEYNRYEQSSSGSYMQSEVHHQERTSGGQYREETRRYGDDNDRSSYGRQQESSSGSYGRNQRDNDNQPSGGYGGGRQQHESGSSGYGGSQSYGSRDDGSSGGGYGRQQESSYGRQQESSYGRQQESSYGRQQESSYGSGGGSGYGRQQESSYGRQEESGYGGRQQESSYGRQEQSSYGRQQESSYSSGGGSGYGSRQDDSNYGRQQESSYGSSGGHGGQQGRRTKKDDSDDEKKNKKKYGKKDDDSEDESRGGGYGRRSKKESDDDDDDDKRYKQHRKKKSDDGDSDEDKKKKKYGRGGESGGYGSSGGYGGGQGGGYGGGGGGYERRDEYSRY